MIFNGPDDWRFLDKQAPRLRLETLLQWRSDAEAGDHDAQCRLGTAFLYGHGVPLNDTEASKWLHLAAEAGHDGATFQLAGLYGKHGNVIEARRWYRKAIEYGSVSALYQMGVLARKSGDLAEAAEWFRQAAGRGHPDAYMELDWLGR